MSKHDQQTLKAPQRAEPGDLAGLAAKAVARAQAARKTFVELNAAQTQEVSGGILPVTQGFAPACPPIVYCPKPPIVAGGIIVKPVLM